MKKKLLLFALVVAELILVFAGCNFSMEQPFYHSENMDLYTVASFSVLGVDASSTKIRRIENDKQGRTLFEVRFYKEGADMFYFQKHISGWLYAYVVSQKSDQQNVYYYENECWEVYEKPDNFTENEKEKLLKRNDWNETIKQELLTARRIIEEYRYKTSASIISNKEFVIYKTLNNIISDIRLQENDFLFKYLLDVDEYGRTVFIIWITHDNKKETEAENASPVTAYFILIQNDGSYNSDTYMTEITDPHNYWRQLIDFEGINSWNKDMV